MKTLKELKEYLKDTAVEIRNKKNKRKGSLHGRVAGLDNLRFTCRHYHLAYCMLRGTDRYAVEATCRRDNYPNMDYVKRIMKNVEDHWAESQKEQEAHV